MVPGCVPPEASPLSHTASLFAWRNPVSTSTSFGVLSLSGPDVGSRLRSFTLNDRPHVTGLGGTPAGMLMGGEGVKIRSSVALPPAGTLLVHVIPRQVVVIVLSPSYSKIAPWSVHGKAEGPAQSSS